MRFPLIVFVLLFLLCLLLFGLACACMSNHSMQAIERALSSVPAAPPLLDVWAVIMLSTLGSVGPLRRRAAAVARGSPADLQRFLL
jgi:uncharacterized SAM-binding protein YcdF (DUF218 family)